jgi:hypothetical protein
MYSNDEKTDMILIYGDVIKKLLPSRVYADNKHFPQKFLVFS